MKKLYKGFIMVLSMFIIFLILYIEWDDDGVKNMMKFYFIIGFIVGGIWSLVYYVMNFLDCFIILNIVIIMIILFIIMGMIYLDGFMDVCDVIFFRCDKEEKFRILKDFIIGVFVVVFLVMLFFL